MKKQAKAQLRHVRIAPRKVRLLIDLIRGMRVADAVVQLELSKKRAARPVLKLLNSAVANAAHNFDILPETLIVKTAFVDGGPILYRWQPRAMGRATPLRKRSSHVTIILEGDAPEKEFAANVSEKKKSGKEKTGEAVSVAATASANKEETGSKTKKKSAPNKGGARKTVSKKKTAAKTT